MILKKKKKKKKQVVLYRINILLFNKDIYVIRNFALGRCWPEKSRFLWDLTLASPGALNLLWKEVAVTLTTGEWGLVWKGCSLCDLGLCGVVPVNLLQVLPEVLTCAASACLALES